MFNIQISPSKLGALEACPCFFQEPYKKSEAAEEGDRLHRAFEKGDLSLLDTQEQKDMVRHCLDYVFGLMPNPLPGGGTSNRPMTEYDLVFREHWLPSDIGKRGRADLIINPASDRKLAHVVDVKFGVVPVEHARTNAQGVDYAYRIFREFPEVERVKVHFVMPRQQDVTTHEFTRANDFQAMRERILRIHERVNDPFRQPSPNLEKACNYCDLKAKCPALADSAVQVSRRFNVLPLPEDFAPTAPRTSEERGLAHDLANAMIAWGEAIKEANSQAVKNFGAEADGYKVQTKKGMVTVLDARSFADAICLAYGVTKDDLLTHAASISLPKTVDLLHQQNPEVDAMEIRSRVERECGAYLKQSPPVSFLVKERKGKRKEDKQRQIDNESASKKLIGEVNAAKATVEE